jgi:two-component system sensor histidine kinase EvgS
MPDDIEEPRQSASPAPGAERPATLPPLVLLVDDHPTNRALLMHQVHALGYAAECAENGTEALQLWESGRFSIIITDCNMPEMSGYDLTRSIRSREAARSGERIPILACTAYALGNEADACFDAGMDDYLVKPVQLAELLRRLKQWLPLSPGGGKTPEVPASASCPGPALLPVDHSVLAAFSGGDATVERDILFEFRRVNDEDTHALAQAVSDKDFARTKLLSHRIKGASKMVGAAALATVCERIHRASQGADTAAIDNHMVAFRRELQRLNAHLDSLK